LADKLHELGASAVGDFHRISFSICFEYVIIYFINHSAWDDEGKINIICDNTPHTLL
jgi:hypothetical protein